MSIHCNPGIRRNRPLSTLHHFLPLQSPGLCPFYAAQSLAGDPPVSLNKQDLTAAPPLLKAIPALTPGAKQICLVQPRALHSDPFLPPPPAPTDSQVLEAPGSPQPKAASPPLCYTSPCFSHPESFLQVPSRMIHRPNLSEEPSSCLHKHCLPPTQKQVQARFPVCWGCSPQRMCSAPLAYPKDCINVLEVRQGWHPLEGDSPRQEGSYSSPFLALGPVPKGLS